jgi:protein TonB
MSEQFIETEIEKEVEDVEVIQPKKKQLSLKQLEHLNNIRIKALEKKREIKLNKMKEYQEKNQKPTVVEEPIKLVQPDPIKPSEPIKSDAKKKKVIKKVIKYVEQDSDDEEEEEEEEEIIVTKKKGKKPEMIPQPVQQVEKSYNDLLCESSLERMQSKIMNERAKHLITHIIPNYY